MIDLFVNGEKVQTDCVLLQEYLAQNYNDLTNFAVAVNEQFISKARYIAFELHDGDKVELVTPMQGG